ncbi:MAG: TadG family pilus assembly protein [Candidatus Dormibacteraceae bacterium]
MRRSRLVSQGGRRGQAGQAIVIVAAAIVALIGAAGLGIDGAEAYFYSAAAARAAEAAALSGVVFMPGQFSTCCGGNNATDRAVAEAARNGFDVADVADNVQVTVARTGDPTQLQVTVSRDVNTFFMGVFGIGRIHISKTALAGYLSPLNLGQPGSQMGSTVSQLGTANNFYFVRMEGWSTPRSEGDAYTPDPNSGSPPSTDVHAISRASGNEYVEDPSKGPPTLPDRGGYNYQAYLPNGGQILVYNAAFAPEGNPASADGRLNFCENQGPPAPPACNPAGPGSNYYLHENDSSFSWGGGKQGFSAMRYTVFKVNNVFVRSQDTEVSQMTVLPIDASNWDQSSDQYLNVNTGATITQTYAANGSPSNMAIYHSWVSVSTYQGTNDGGLVSYTAGNGPLGGDLPPGLYRLRVDALNYDGSLPPGGSKAHKAIAIKLLGPNGAACDTGAAPCTLGAWDDMAVYTPVQGTAFTIPIFQLPPSYAGQTIEVDIFDPGDINANGGSATLNILDAAGNIVTSGASPVSIYDLGTDRANGSGPITNSCQMASPVSNPPCLLASGGNASFVANNGGADYFNGHWVRVEIPVPGNYNPAGSPSQWYWKLQYATTRSVTATDTITLKVSLKGAPAHLLSG